MKVIKNGRPDPEATFETTCGHCETVFQYKTEEATFVKDELELKCPVCDGLLIIKQTEMGSPVQCTEDPPPK